MKESQKGGKKLYLVLHGTPLDFSFLFRVLTTFTITIIYITGKIRQKYEKPKLHNKKKKKKIHSGEAKGE